MLGLLNGGRNEWHGPAGTGDLSARSYGVITPSNFNGRCQRVYFARNECLQRYKNGAGAVRWGIRGTRAGQGQHKTHDRESEARGSSAHPGVKIGPDHEGGNGGEASSEQDGTLGNQGRAVETGSFDRDVCPGAPFGKIVVGSEGNREDGRRRETNPE